jgi:hypothetical protein
MTGFFKKWLTSSVFLACLTVAGCTSMCEKTHYDMTPEEVVETYLNISLNMQTVAEKERLLPLATGNLKASLEAADDETIKKAFVDINYDLLAFSIVESRPRTPREVEITFELQYKNFGSDPVGTDKPVPTTTIENTLSVIKDKRLWKIQDIIGAKTSFDFPVMPESIIKAKP